MPSDTPSRPSVDLSSAAGLVERGVSRPTGPTRPSVRARVSILTAASALIVTLVSPGTSAARDAIDILAAAPMGGPTVDLLVGARPGRRAAVAILASNLGSHDRGFVPGLAVRRIRVPADVAVAVMRSLTADPAVAFVEPDAPARTSLTPNDPFYPHGYEWGLDVIGAPAAWDIATGASGPVIAVIDTGVDASHEDLGGRVLPGYDFVNSDADPYDDNGHGTHVSGIIAATGNNELGGAGVCWGCRILPVKVLDATGSGWYSTLAAGVIWAADHDARIINMSLGGNTNSQTLAQAVAYAQEKGIVVVAAAGNNGAVMPAFFPAALPGVIAVAAEANAGVGATPFLMSFSNYGADWVSVAAPGCTTSTWPRNGYHDMCGTSMATPFVSGSLGLLLDADPAASATVAANALLGTAGPGLRDVTADGEIHTDVALSALLSGDVPPPVPMPTPTPTPEPIPSPTAEPTPIPTPEPTPEPTPTSTPAPTPTSTPAPTPTPTPEPTPTPTPEPTPTPDPTPPADTAAPIMTALSAPSLVTSATRVFTVAFTGSDDVGVTAYEIRMKKGAAGTWSTTTTQTASSRTFSSLPAGSWYIDVRARDAVGNLSGWRETVVLVPTDDRAWSFSAGTTRRTGSANLLGTITTTYASGSKMKILFSGSSFSLVGTVGRYYGKLRITLDGRSYTVDTGYFNGVRATSNHHRIVIFSRSLTTGKHSATITCLATSGRRTIAIDAVGWRN